MYSQHFQTLFISCQGTSQISSLLRDATGDPHRGGQGRTSPDNSCPTTSSMEACSPGGSPCCSGTQLPCTGGCSSGRGQALQPQLKSSCFPTGQPESLPRGTGTAHSCSGYRLATSTGGQMSKNGKDACRVITETIM